MISYKILWTIPILVLIYLCVIVLKKLTIRKDDKEFLNEDRPPSGELDNLPYIENDKMITIRNVDQETVDKVLQQICNLSNETSYRLIARLFAISPRDFVITFPFDINFFEFCNLINYLKYPHDMDFNYSPVIMAWCTITRKNDLNAKELLNQKVLIFVPDGDTDIDFVYIVNSRNDVFKLSFKIFNRLEKIADSSICFKKPEFDIKDFSVASTAWIVQNSKTFS